MANKLQAGDKVEILPHNSPTEQDEMAGKIGVVLFEMDDYPDWYVIDVDGQPYAYEFDMLEKVE